MKRRPNMGQRSYSGLSGWKSVSLTEQTIDSKATQRIHFGNLAPSASEADVRALFAVHGAVTSYERPSEDPAKSPAGYAFVVMSQADAPNAIKAVDGHELGGQALKVSEARPRA